MEPVQPGDLEAVAVQLGRTPRGVVAVGWRCPCGQPGVLVTQPRLPDGTPFPTTYYLTCARAIAACSKLEANGVMAQMNAQLETDPVFRAAYQRAHQAYLDDREELGQVEQIAGISAGGMPQRVKCLHALVAHSLAGGPGTNPVGDQALDLIGEFWTSPCPKAASKEDS